MCLEILASIAPDAKARISAARLSQVCGLVVSSRRMDGKTSLHFAVTGGCSCEFLVGGAEWDGETWAFAPEHLPKLSQAVLALTRECRKFALVARRLNGERLSRIERISGSTLAKLITDNKVGNNVLYVVG